MSSGESKAVDVEVQVSTDLVKCDRNEISLEAENEDYSIVDSSSMTVEYREGDDGGGGFLPTIDIPIVIAIIVVLAIFLSRKSKGGKVDQEKF